MPPRLPLLFAIALLPLPLASCAKEREYDAKVKVERVELVETDDKGAAVSTDVDIRFHQCPGIQRQTMRSGKAFTACIAAKKLKAGDEVDVKVHWEWDEHGHYDFHVIRLAGCEAPPVDDDDSSWVSAAACEPSLQHDAVVGFHCDRVGDHGEPELLQKCPWFRLK